MLTFLHTAEQHAATFEQLVQELDSEIPTRHIVDEAMLARALSANGDSGSVRTAVADALKQLAREGAKVIVCTCSTLGGLAESASPAGVQVLRIDRPMVELAVASGRHILIVAALEATFTPTTDLLSQIAQDMGHSIQTTRVLCERAWPFFEAGDTGSYLAEVENTIRQSLMDNSLILLAQASMHPLVERLAHLELPVLSSPKLGTEAAIRMYLRVNVHA